MVWCVAISFQLGIAIHVQFATLDSARIIWVGVFPCFQLLRVWWGAFAFIPWSVEIFEESVHTDTMSKMSVSAFDFLSVASASRPSTCYLEEDVEYSCPHSIGEAECRITQQDCCKVVCGSVFPSEPETNTWVYFPKSSLCHGDQPWDPDGLIKTKLCTAHNPQKQRLADKSNITRFKKMHTIDKIYAFEIVRIYPS